MASTLKPPGFLVRDDLASLAVSGPDRVRFLNAMLTNDVALATPTRAMIALKLTPKGGIEALVRVRASGDVLVLDVAQDASRNLLSTLSQHLLMDDCAVVDASSEWTTVSVLGDPTGEILNRIATTGSAHEGVMPGLVGWDLCLRNEDCASAVSQLLAAGARQLAMPDLEAARIESGVPGSRRELCPDVFPMEVGLMSCVSTTKGCYVGQEVVARATNRGHVRYALVGLACTSTEILPSPGHVVVSTAGGGAIGEVTSSMARTSADGWIGLALVRREAAVVGDAVALEGHAQDTSRVPVIIVGRFDAR